MNKFVKYDDLQRFINGLKNQINIVDVAEKYVHLRKFGNRYRGLCPFHHERTPSFTVFADSGRFKCFGCGAYGDSIDLYGRLHGIDTRSAIRQMVEEYGVHESERSPVEKTREIAGFLKKKRLRLRELLLQWVVVLEDWMCSLKDDDDLERYGELYHEIITLECWLNNLEYVDAAQLKRMYQHIPVYLNGIYEKHWGAGWENGYDG